MSFACLFPLKITASFDYLKTTLFNKDDYPSMLNNPSTKSFLLNTNKSSAFSPTPINFTGILN